MRLITSEKNIFIMPAGGVEIINFSAEKRFLYIAKLWRIAKI
jgi:hypothetical protein